MRTIGAALLAVASLALAATSLVQAQTRLRPSFDCAAARASDERAICSDARLAELDRDVASAYGQASASNMTAGSARGIARDGLAARHACGADRLCILDQQASDLNAFEDLGSHVPVPPWVGDSRLTLFRSEGKRPTQGLPRRVGQCTIAKIASISGRVGGELKPPSSASDSSGSLVQYAGGGLQVSYDYVAALGDSRIGDEVLVCLVSLPKDCPPGDDRGKTYSGTNLRTKGSWILPDSQHMCGGA